MTSLKKTSALDLLISQRNEKEYAKTKSRMCIAMKIADALKAQGLSQKDLALKLGKKPSEISKWLTGNHNFTHDTLFDIQEALNINLLNAEIAQNHSFVNNNPIKIKYRQTPKKFSGYPAEIDIKDLTIIKIKKVSNNNFIS